MSEKEHCSHSKINPEIFELEFSLKALNESVHFRVSSLNSSTIHEFFYAFLSIFPGVLNYETRTINALTAVSKEFRKDIHDFVLKREAKTKSLKAVEAFVNRLADGEQFFVLPQLRPSQQQSIVLHNHLAAGGDEAIYYKLSRETDDMFKDLMEEYLILPYGDKRKVIGEAEKAKRICRFCDRSLPEVTFNKKAHAISEALGNKTLVLTEECDSCNERFATTIEPELIEYLALNRAIYGIKGKRGAKNYEGKNFKISRDEKLELQYFDEREVDMESRNVAAVPGEITLRSKKQIAKQNIYRTFVKYALSVIDEEHLKYFGNTKKWINGEFNLDKLPPVAVFFFAKLAEQPILTIYLRKTDNISYPFAVGELHFALSKYCFIIPLSEKDEIDFTTNDSYEVASRSLNITLF